MKTYTTNPGMNTKLNWVTNGKASFLNFSAGRAVTGIAMVGQTPKGWVSGARLLGRQSCEQGYYLNKAETTVFGTREEAEADALRLAEVSIQKDCELKQYLFDLDKKSPWKNSVAPALTPIKFEV